MSKIFEDEIIVGVNVKKDENNKSKNKKKHKKTKNRNSKKSNNSPKNTQKKETRTSSNLNVLIKRKRLKTISIIIIAIIFFAIILSSSLFNIKKIEVEGNDRLSADKIISLSKLELYNNIFRFSKSEVISNIKGNAYIESVAINRTLPSTVHIKIEEREPKYMLQFADSYVYINNQGYMLDITNEKLNIPILLGFTTDLSNIKAGNRINVEDLKKMNMVIKIYETAKSNDLGDLISKIDISNDKNYTIILDSEGKTVYLGDASDLNTRILHLKAILERLEGKSGEIFLDVDLNEHNAYFRPSTN